MPDNLEITSLKTIAKGAAVYFIGMLLSKIIAFFYRVFAARYFGPADYGLFSIGLAIIGFLGVIAVLGLESGVSRYIPFYRARGDEKRVKSVLTSCLKMVTLFSIIVGVILFVLSPYIAQNFFQNTELILVLIILAVSIPFTSITTIFSHAFLGFKRVQYQAYSSVILNVVKLATIIVFGFMGMGVLGLSWSWTIAYVIMFLFSFYFLQKKVYPVFRNSIKGIAMKKELLIFSLPLVLGSAASVVLSWTDTLVLGLMKTSVDVGIYNAVTPLMQLLLVIPFAFTAIFGPVLSELYSKGKIIEMKNIYKTVTRWMFYVNFPFFLLLVAFPSPIMNLFFGTQYVSGYLALLILSLGNITVSVELCALSLMATFKKTKQITGVIVISALLNIFLNVYLIPLHGITGAATATAVSVVFGNILMIIWAKRFIKTTPLTWSLLKPVLAGILSIAVLFFALRLLFSAIPVYILIISFVLFLILYWLLLILLKAFNESDMEMLSVIERKTCIKLGFLRRFM